MAKGLRWTEQQYAEDAAKRSRWTNNGTKADGEAMPAVNVGIKTAPIAAASSPTPQRPPAPVGNGLDVPPLTSSAGGHLTLVLPLPPSVNVLYGQAANGHKFLQAPQRAFRSHVGQVLAARGAEPFAGRLEMRVTLYFGNRRRSDIDNRLKAILDACAHGGAYHDDSQIDVLFVERVVRPKGEEECVVTVREVA